MSMIRTVLLLLFAGVSSFCAGFDPPASVCSRDGFFRNPFDCTRFYRCVEVSITRSFNIYHFQCPQGTVFDPAIQVCNFPFNSAPCRDNDNFASGSTPRPQVTDEPPGLGIPIVPGQPYPPDDSGESGIIILNPGQGSAPVILPPHPVQPPFGTLPGTFVPPAPPIGFPDQGTAPGQGPPFEEYPDQGTAPGQGPPFEQYPDQGTAPGIAPPENSPGSSDDSDGSQSVGNGDETYPDGGIPFAPPGELPDYGDDYDLSDYPEYSYPYPDDNSPGVQGGAPVEGDLSTTSPDDAFIGPGFEDNSDGSDAGTIGKPPSGSGGGISFPKPPFGSGNKPGGSGDNQSGTSSGGAGGSSSSQGSKPGLGGSSTSTSTNRPFSSSTSSISSTPISSPTSTSSSSSTDSDQEYEVYPESIFNCPAPGFFPYEHNCQEFYVCQEVLPGKLLADQLYRCPKRYLFDEDTRRCQREEKVNCRKFSYSASENPFSKQAVLVVLEEYIDQFFTTPLRYEETRRRFGYSDNV